MLTRADFADVYAALNDGHRPFAWQERLIDQIVQTGQWPQVINAPTGSGKSCVVDVHVFANALYASGSGPRVPRRLSVVVNRRALVDHHHIHATQIAHLLRNEPSGVLADLAAALASLTGGKCEPLGLAMLRGGVAPEREWINDPRTCAVIAATPDMWGSRLLFRGYGSARHAWPREAGLLSMDSVVVLDEAHLSQQMRHTAMQVSDLNRPVSDALGVPCLQVVATTATPAETDASHVVAVGVSGDDLTGPNADLPLVARLTRPKPVRYHVSSKIPAKVGKDSAAYINELVRLALDLRQSVPSDTPGTRTIGCVVNHVDTAARLADRLRAALAKADEDGEVACWVGRMRPMDLQAARTRHPGLFTVAGDPAVAFVVATQTIEVGVDLDFAGLVTELAPGTSLAQRAGRVNRLGLRERAEVVVVGPARQDIQARLPYLVEELTAAHDWIEVLAQSEEGMSPIRLSGSLTPPAADLARPVFSDFTPADALNLSETSAALLADTELTFWLRDDLADEPDSVSVVVRSGLPESDDCALTLLEATPAHPDEMFPATVAAARGLLERVGKCKDPSRARVFIVRAGQAPDVVRDDTDLWLRDGDVLVVDDGHPLTLSGVIVNEPPVPSEKIDTVWGDHHNMVWFADDHGEQIAALVALRLVSSDAVAEAAHALVGFTAQVTFAPKHLWVDGLPPWIVFAAPKTLLTDGELRQEWAPTAGPVTLEKHSQAVADRSRLIAAHLGLPGQVVDALELAGELHDAGKADLRFQDKLGWCDGPHLAKSAGSAQSARLRRGQGALPRGWRHEQVSAGVAVTAVAAHTARDLIVRLVGTSHGHGRPFFPLGTEALLPTDSQPVADPDVLAMLYATGSGWSDVLDATNRRYGVWGCAYLEGILRAADGQVSGEGS